MSCVLHRRYTSYKITAELSAEYDRLHGTNEMLRKPYLAKFPAIWRPTAIPAIAVPKNCANPLGTTSMNMNEQALGKIHHYHSKLSFGQGYCVSIAVE